MASLQGVHIGTKMHSVLVFKRYSLGGIIA